MEYVPGAGLDKGKASSQESYSIVFWFHLYPLSASFFFAGVGAGCRIVFL